MDYNYRPYNVYHGKELEIKRESDDEIFAGEWCVDKMKYKKNILSFGTYGTSICEPHKLASFTLDSTHQNNLILGLQGCGKKPLIRNIQIQICEQNRGFIDFITNSKDIDKIVSRIPKDRQNDIIVVDPTDSNIGFNLLNNPIVKSNSDYDESCDIIAKNLTDILQHKCSYWNDQIEKIFKHLVASVVKSEKNFNIVDLADILKNKEKTKDFVSNFSQNEEIQDLFDSIDYSELDPILRVLNSWIEDNIVNKTVSQTSSEFNLYNSILNDKIIIFDFSVVDKQPLSDLIMLHIKNIIKLLPFNNQVHIFLQEYEKFSSDCFSEFIDINCGLFVSVSRIDNFNEKSIKLLNEFDNKICFRCENDGNESSLVKEVIDKKTDNTVVEKDFICNSYINSDNSDNNSHIRVFRDRKPVADVETENIKQRSEENFGSRILSRI